MIPDHIIASPAQQDVEKLLLEPAISFYPFYRHISISGPRFFPQRELLAAAAMEENHSSPISSFLNPRMVSVMISYIRLKGDLFMSKVMPEGEDLRKAVKWISYQLEDGSGKSVNKLIEQAVFSFDLSPKDAEYLMSFFKGRK
jgi:hypothetical protein